MKKRRQRLTAIQPMQPRKVAFAPEVFASEAEYDQSVASVVARIQSRQAPPRHPDEYPTET